MAAGSGQGVHLQWALTSCLERDAARPGTCLVVSNYTMQVPRADFLCSSTMSVLGPCQANVGNTKESKHETSEQVSLPDNVTRYVNRSNAQLHSKCHNYRAVGCMTADASGKKTNPIPPPTTVTSYWSIPGPWYPRGWCAAIDDSTPTPSDVALTTAVTSRVALQLSIWEDCDICRDGTLNDG